MYGFTMGSLNVYFKREDSAPQLMFSKSGNQGNQWLNGIFNLPKSNVSFQVRASVHLISIKKLLDKKY